MTTNNKVLLAALVAVAIIVALVVLPFGKADATPGEKVTICHATNSQTNPYTANTVDSSSIDEEKNQYLNGHGDHLGPVWYDGIAAHAWGDIIPPFINDETGNSYPGYNWNAEGQAIYHNGCSPVTPPAPPTETPTPTPPVVTPEVPVVTPEVPVETPETETPTPEVETPEPTKDPEPEKETPASNPPVKNPPKNVQVIECVNGTWVTTVNGEVISESGTCERSVENSTPQTFLETGL